MLTTQAASVIAFLATTTLVSAHGHVASWTVNGEKKAGFNPSNAAQYGSTAERPTTNSDQGFSDWTTGVVACGGTSAGSGLETWDLDAGSTVTAHWNTWPDSHKGSVAEYMARCPGTTCDGVAADSLNWFKIDEASFSGGKWPTETVVSTLDWSFKIPSDLAPGPYLVRHDLLAMHTIGAPQVYPVCFQANLVGSGSAIPASTVKFPAAYNINPEFKTWSIYNNDNTAFPPPGPAVYAGGGGGAAPPAPVPVSTSSAVVVVPASSSAVVVVPSSAGPAPASSSAAPVYSSAVAPVPAPTTKPAAPSSAVVVAPVSSSKPVAPVPSASTAPVVTPPTTGGALGGSAPAITKNGDKFIVNGGSYNFEGDAKYASCMSQMNKCKNWANTLPNAEVGPAFSLCDSQAAQCFTGSKKRDVMNRYTAKRALLSF